MPFSVKTLAGQSAPATVRYAGVPKVTAVVNTVNSTELAAPTARRTPAGPRSRSAAGGSPASSIAPIEFTDTVSPFSVGTQYAFTVNGDTSLSTQTVAQNPAIVDVRLCTVTACSLNRPADLLYLYPPGNPRVTSVSPASGPAAGGTKVTIGGQNLGCPLEVFFGNVKAKSVTPVKALLDCGSTARVQRHLAPGDRGHRGTGDRRHHRELFHRLRPRHHDRQVRLQVTLLASRCRR